MNFLIFLLKTRKSQLAMIVDFIFFIADHIRYAEQRSNLAYLYPNMTNRMTGKNNKYKGIDTPVYIPMPL